MSISHLLETFEDQSTQSSHSDSVEDNRADEELALFETGYKAGWDDCHKAAQASATALSEDFAQNMRELSFTYQEAYTAVIRSLEPVVKELITGILPEVAAQSLSQQIAQEVTGIAKHAAGSPILVTSHSSKQALLRAALPKDLSLDIKLTPDDSYPSGKVSLRFSGNEREVDITNFAQQAHALITNYFDDLTREPNNG